MSRKCATDMLVCAVLLFVGQWLMMGDAHAQSTINIHASAAFKRSAEYAYLVKNLGYRGIKVLNKRGRAGLCLSRGTRGRVCFCQGKRIRLFRGLSRLKMPSSRAHAIILFLDAFLQQPITRLPSRQERRQCGCYKRPTRRIKRRPRRPLRVSQPVSKRPAPLKVSKQPLKQAVPSRAIPTRIAPPVKIKPSNEPGDDPPSFAIDPKQTRKRKGIRPWMAFGVSASAFFNMPLRVLPGGVASLRFGIGSFRLQAALHIHAFPLTSGEYLLLNRPSFLIEWSPPTQVILAGRPLSFGLQVGANSEHLVLELAHDEKEYMLQWGLLLGLRVQWQLHPNWSIFQRTAYVIYPLAEQIAQRTPGLVSSTPTMQVLCSFGVEARFHFF